MSRTSQFVNSVQHVDGLVGTGLHKGPFRLRTDRSGQPVLTNGNLAHLCPCPIALAPICSVSHRLLFGLSCMFVRVIIS